MRYPLVGDLAADGIPVAVTCRVLGFSKQAFYKWLAAPVTDREWSDAHLINTALEIHGDDPAFGYRFITDELAERGVSASENRVQRLCTQQGIWSVTAKRRGLGRKPGPAVHGDLVEREFTALAPNVVWLADITEHPTGRTRSPRWRTRSTRRSRPGTARICPPCLSSPTAPTWASRFPARTRRGIAVRSGPAAGPADRQ